MYSRERLQNQMLYLVKLKGGTNIGKHVGDKNSQAIGQNQMGKINEQPKQVQELFQTTENHTLNIKFVR